ncbi:MAG: hypothetical protein OQL16_10075, partial [Gammaproteobacteria bacterium]|nr:hypothetical protein [Gammaproteobacteria bacterium]
MKLNSQLVLAIVLVTSCMNIWAEDQQAGGCENAEDEIAQLKKQKKSTGGLLSKTPIGMVAKAATDSKEDKQKKKAAKAHN